MSISGFYRQRRGVFWLTVLALAAGIGLLIFGSLYNPEKEKVSGDSLVAYEKQLEDKISELCRRVEGVSDVTVAVCLSGGFENVYARDGENNYVLVGNGSHESGVLIGERAPEIAGVAIVCRGGGDPTIQHRLMMLISSACGIGTNKVYITEAQK